MIAQGPHLEPGRSIWKRLHKFMRGIIWHWACDKRGLELETQEAPPVPCPHEYFQIQFTHLFNT